MIECRYGALILAGGKGKRMGGVSKAELTFGDTTFLSILEETMGFLSPGYLSTNQEELAKGTTLEPVKDRIPDCGPMGGIYSVLSICSCDALLVLPCDMPFFSRQLAERLIQEHAGEAVLYLKDAREREYPLCGIYTKACIPVLEKLLWQKDFRMRQVRERVGGRILQITNEEADQLCFLNVNTPEAYEWLKEGAKELRR